MLTTVLLAASLAVGQSEEVGPTYEHLKTYESFIGTWKYDGPLIKKDGEKDANIRFVMELSWEWIFNKAAIEHAAKIVVDGDTSFAVKTLVAWNAESQELVSQGVNMLGKPTRFLLKFSPDGKTLSGGPKGNVVYEYTVTGPDSLTVEIVGLERPEYPLKRCKCEDDDDEDDEEDEDGDDDDD